MHKMLPPTTQENIKLYTFFSQASLVASLITSIALSIESYLNKYGNSLCKTSACEIVGNYLKIPEDLLVTFGALSFWLLTLLIFFSLRYPKKLASFPLLCMAAALCFDAGLMGFQFFTIEKFCTICLAVAAALLLSFILYAISQRAWLTIFVCLLCWSGAFGVHALLKIPEPSNANRQMILLKTTPSDHLTQSQITTVTLIFSMECPHCLELIDTIAKHNDFSETSWQFASTDQDQNSQKRLAAFLNQVPNATNPFKLLSKIKNDPISTEITIPDSIKKANRKTLTFLSNLSIDQIPVLLVETPDNNKQIFVGGNAASLFLEKEFLPDVN